jgi:MFS family permease
VSPILAWWHQGTPEGRRAVIAAGLGWMLDAFDVTLFALVLPALRKDLDLSPAAGGALGSIALLAAAAGGVGFGWVSDRFGRTRALMSSIVLYSVFTAACGLATTFSQFVFFRIGLGLGMGGEWASGATLVSETWAAEHRGKALALMQSAWAVGYALAAAVNYFIQPPFGWRAVFFVGILPAFLTIWVRRTVKEPEIWRQANMTRAPRSTLRMLFSNGLAPVTIALTIMNACTLFGWWSFNLWLPSFLQEPVSRGGVGLEILSSSTMIVVMQVGMWFGYITFGFVSDRIGRKRTYIAYLLSAAFLLLIYVSVRAPMMLLALGPFVAFCATGYFSGFGAVTAEIFPTMIRGTAQGFTYNVGRIVSAAAPFAVGTLAQTQGFGTALSISSLAFLAAAVTWIWIPETRGRALT